VERGLSGWTSLATRFDRWKEMVDITIYIEGVQSENSAVLTVDSRVHFREHFHQLFSQKLSPTEFNLRIKPFGSIYSLLE